MASRDEILDVHTHKQTADTIEERVFRTLWASEDRANHQMVRAQRTAQFAARLAAHLAERGLMVESELDEILIGVVLS